MDVHWVQDAGVFGKTFCSNFCEVEGVNKEMEQNIVSKFKLVPHSSRPTFIRSHRKKQIEDDYNKLVERIRTAKHERTREAKEEGLFQMEMIMITLGYDFKEDE